MAEPGKPDIPPASKLSDLPDPGKSDILAEFIDRHTSTPVHPAPRLSDIPEPFPGAPEIPPPVTPAVFQGITNVEGVHPTLPVAIEPQIGAPLVTQGPDWRYNLGHIVKIEQPHPDQPNLYRIKTNLGVVNIEVKSLPKI